MVIASIFLINELRKRETDRIKVFADAMKIQQSNLNIDSDTFCERFLKEKKVAIVPGKAFGVSGEGYVRISYAAAIDDIKEAMLRLAAFVNELKNEEKT